MLIRPSPFHLQIRHLKLHSSLFTLKRATYRTMSTNSTSPPTATTSSADVENQNLTSLLPPNGRWILHTPPSSLSSLSRTFHFKTFKAAWSFMTTVAEECKKRRHHPEWSNVYNTVFVRWTTHRPRDPSVSPGVTGMDVEMAGFCDERAKEAGEVFGGEDWEREKKLLGVVEEVKKAAGDCCGVGKKES